MTGRVLSAVSTIDYEVYSAFNITVLATDNGSPARSIRKAVRIKVSDVNHPPTSLTFSGGYVSIMLPVFKSCKISPADRFLVCSADAFRVKSHTVQFLNTHFWQE